MNTQLAAKSELAYRPDAQLPGLFSLPVKATKQERLPFTVRLVRSQDDLDKAVHIRHAAYARHVPEFAQSLKQAEQKDGETGVVILLAESKLDGSPLGTMRIQSNQYKPLALEQSVTLPHWLQDRSLAEATRLGVTDEKTGRLVKTVLFKAFYLYCVQNDIEWMVVTGRAPIDRQYERLMFKDVYPELGYIPLPHVGNMLHRIMSFSVNSAESNWAAAQHPMFDFIFRTHHPDIDVGSDVGNAPDKMNKHVSRPIEFNKNTANQI
ncbi:MAG: hypothetical protein V4805_10790 [Pseudomonadota bacterium]